MTVTVFPEDGDSGAAAAAREMFQAVAVDADYIYTGYTMSDGGGLVVSVAAGEAVMAGEHVHETSALTTTLANNNTNYVYLTHAAGSATTLTDNTTGSLPADSVLIGTVVTSGGSITTISHEKNIENARNVFIRKTADETVNNSAAVQDDNDLQFAVLAGQAWEFKICLLFNSPSADTSDFRYVTNQSVGNMFTLAVARSDLAAGVALASEILAADTEGRADLSDLGSSPNAIIQGWFVAEADGDFKFRWAQWSAVAHDTKILTDSFLVARRLLG